MRASKQTFDRARRLRHDMTLPEVLLWQKLRRHQLDGHPFRWQHPVGPYILDFYCAERRLAIEVDGASHDFDERAAHDLRRAEWLAGESIQIIRLLEKDVLSGEGIEGVLDMVRAALDARPPPQNLPPSGW